MTEVWLIFANQTEEDILLREELEACVKASEGRWVLEGSRSITVWQLIFS